MVKKNTDKVKSAASKPHSAEIHLKKTGRSCKSAFPETPAGKPDSCPEVSKREKIELLAYSFWVQRGCQGGSPEEDWFRAELEINSQSSN